MALIKCPECGKEISDKAAACINCGCPVSAMNPPPAAPAKPDFNEEAFNTACQEIFEKPATQPTKTVPTEEPTAGCAYGVLASILEKLCGLSGLAGFWAVGTIVVSMLRIGNYDEETLPIAFFGLAGGWLLSGTLQLMEFFRMKKFLKKNGYEDSIRNDTPDMTNSRNAFHLCRTMTMVRYIKRLNPVTGKALETACKQSKKEKRKERLGYLPYLAILAAAYNLLPRFGWQLFPSDEMCLVAAHPITLLVMGVYGYKKDLSFALIAVAAVLFAPTIFAYYTSDLWYHILICAASAFVGMIIGLRVRKNK